MRLFLSQAICIYMDLSSLTKLTNKLDVTKLISTEINANFVATVYVLPKFDECQEVFLPAWKTHNFG